MIGLLRAHAREVLALGETTADHFLKYLRATQEILQGRLDALGGDVNAFTIQKALHEAKLAIALLERKMTGAFAGAQDDAADLAIEHLRDELDHLSVKFDDKPLDVTIQAQTVLSDPSQLLLAEQFASSASKYGHDLLNVVRQRLFVGLAAGDSTSAVAKDIAAERGPFGAVGERNAERIARTETSQAYGAAQHKGAEEAAKVVPGLRKMWLHIGSYPCDTCMPLHGTERPLDGTWTITSGKHTRKVAHPPGHPHCVCRVVTIKGSWKSKLAKLGYLAEDEPQPAASKKKPPSDGSKFKGELPEGDRFQAAAESIEKPTSQREMRSWLRDRVTDEFPELTHHDEGRRGAAKIKLGVPRAPGAVATHDWDGSIVIRPEEFAKLKALPSKDKISAKERDGLATLVHEALHGFVPITPTQYNEVKHLASLNEAVVEILAQRIVNRHYPGTRRTGSAYQRNIGVLIRFIQEHRPDVGDGAYGLLETAALKVAQVDDFEKAPRALLRALGVPSSLEADLRQRLEDL